MTVNHSSTLTVEYFLAYFRLVTLSKEVNVLEAKQYIDSTFFKGDPSIYGTNTYQNFLHAHQALMSLNNKTLEVE
ncbi:hypothetical protein [Bacillus suaedaesalsae]|uniref:YozE SAM-like domain-containing protein n=1 Tax=Bacillus suaedaesalsae TaxID=2810349 RepID=A0ABS2DCT8_9BACI|nr:hypothetical protein [Bacillus suaedaesalsae]MBM6616282.1 hypothetical protein [Bacillus suaedaesalsae]